MSEHSLWRFSRALQIALRERQTDQLEDLLDDDVDWAIYGPIDMFGFLGARHGKAAVLEAIGQIAKTFRLRQLDREAVLLGDNSAASLMRCSLTPERTGKPISVRLAQFTQFKDGRVTQLRVVVDTFDLVEQVLGRTIHLPQMA